MSEEELEKVTDSPKDRQYYETELPRHIHDFYFEHFRAESTEDIAKCSQNSWVACLEYCKRKCINRCDLITVTEHRIHPQYGGTGRTQTYDGSKVCMLANIYCQLCFLYDKLPSVFGFSTLSGIDREWMQTCVSAGRVTMSDTQNTLKKAVESIRAARQQSLLNAAATGGKNTVGSIAILNNEVWKYDEILPENGNKSLTGVDLPVFLEDIPRLNELEDKPDFELPRLDTAGKLGEI